MIQVWKAKIRDLAHSTTESGGEIKGWGEGRFGWDHKVKIISEAKTKLDRVLGKEGHHWK